MQLGYTISLIQRGDKSAERDLFDATCGILKSVAVRYVIDRDEADDILQESYIRIFKNIGRFQYTSEGATISWMKQITVTEALRIIKKKKRWSQEHSTLLGSTTHQETPSFQDDLYHLLLQLSDQQRIVFNMHALEGYSHEEISEQLNIAIGTSRSLLSRARAILQNNIKKNEQHARA